MAAMTMEAMAAASPPTSPRLQQRWKQRSTFRLGYYLSAKRIFAFGFLIVFTAVVREQLYHVTTAGLFLVHTETTVEPEVEQDPATKRLLHYKSVIKYAKGMERDRELHDPYLPASTTLAQTPILKDVPTDLLPKARWTTQSHFPDVLVVGLPKGGTSQLGKILLSHPKATKFNAKAAEECAYYDQSMIFLPIVGPDFTAEQQNSTHKGLHQYFSNRPKLGPKNGKKTVSVCLNIQDGM